jgi:hypothetical protein
MKTDLKYAHVSDDINGFHAKIASSLQAFINEGFDFDIHYAQSTQLDGVIIFSALIVGKQDVA